MGLFSRFRKNKQETTDSGFYSADDASATAKARSKRASNAGAAAAPRRTGKETTDSVLPEKKRARRRLVGAIALALAVAVGLPMVLDSEPKPLASDIAIQIPSKDKPPAETAASAASSRVSASAALDQSEEIIDVPATPAPVVVPPAPVVKAHIDVPPAKPEARVEPRAEARIEPRAEAPKVVAKAKAEPEVKPEIKPEIKPRVAEVKPVPKPVPKVDDNAENGKPGQTGDEAARALAILEGKPAAKPATVSSGHFVLQVAALATQDKVDELQGKLSEAGIHSYTQKIPTATGQRTRVRVGPFGSREEAEKVRAKLSRLGLNGSVVPA
ncbi:DedD protein [Oxalobacteraceae bacterium GrIS 1.11]